MHGTLRRDLEATLDRELAQFPAVSLVGPRQCGKTTLAKRLVAACSATGAPALYLDLERPSDRQRVAADPETFLRRHADALVCLDEVQHLPGIFELLRALIDEARRPGRFLLLGSASPELLRQSSETLAGRVATRELTPFRWSELAAEPRVTLESLWLRGGFPESVLSVDDASSFRWREEFTRTFLERDLSQLGFRVPAKTLERFWRMCAHLHGQPLNLAALGRAMGTSPTASRHHVDLLAGTFMLRLLEPCERNLGKRIVKSPKVYLRDSGLVHALLAIETLDDLDGHPVRGASWEGFVIEQLIGAAAGWRPSFYRTTHGAELDLVLEKGRRRLAFECKASASPRVTRGFWTALQDLEIQEAFVVAPLKRPFPMGSGVEAVSVEDAVARLMA